MPRHYQRQDSVVVVTPTDPVPVITGGTVTIPADATGSAFQVNSTATGNISFSQSILEKAIPSSSTTSSASATSSSASVSVQQPIPVRTLVAICVAAFVLVAGLVLFVLWFGSRSRKNKGIVHQDVALNISNGTSGEDIGFKGIPPSHPGNIKGFASEQSSYYSQSTGRKPILAPQQHSRRPTVDSLDQHKLDLNPYTYNDESSFLPKQNVYSRFDMAPLSPRSANRAAQDPDTPKSGATSPRSGSAQAITKPYVIGSHPFASPGRGTPQSRPSIEHSGNYTVAVSYPEQPDGQGLGLSGHNSFASPGIRPGYNAYGIESRQPITALNARPSLESIRSLARKNSIDQTAVTTATEFAMGGPTAVGTRSRNNSTSSSHHRNASNYGSSMYGGSIYGNGSIRSGKEGGKEKLSKQEKAREMKAMDNLIAALDESAEKDKRRKGALAAAAGLGDLPSPTGSTRKREADRVDGTYPLPPANVFRAALAPATGVGMGNKIQDDDWVDDEEIERWRRR